MPPAGLRLQRLPRAVRSTCRKVAHSSALKTGLWMRLVAQRPQGTIGEARCSSLPPPVARATDDEGGTRWRLRRDEHRVSGVDDIAVCASGAVRNPDPAAFPHQGIERDGHAAGRGLGNNGAVGRSFVQPGLAIGHNHQFVGGLRILASLGQSCDGAGWGWPVGYLPDDRHHQRLEPHTPQAVLGGRRGGQAQRHAGCGQHRPP